MNRISRYLAAILLGLILPVWGCGGGTGTGGTFGSAETLTFEGWDAYTKQGLSQAEELFKNALSLDPGYSGAYDGLGWLNFRRAGQASSSDQNTYLQAAELNFTKATAADPTNADAWAGLAGLYVAEENWNAAQNAANQVLSLNPRYFSSHDNVDYTDIHLILAEAYFFMGWFVNTPSTPDPNNSLYHLNVVSPGFAQLYAQNKLSPPDLIRKIQELQIQ